MGVLFRQLIGKTSNSSHVTPSICLYTVSHRLAESHSQILAAQSHLSQISSTGNWATSVKGVWPV